MTSIRRIMLLAGLICLCSAVRLKAQVTASFNFSQGPQNVSGWINLHGNPASAPITGTDPSTGITVSSIAAANWASYTGNSTADAGGATGGTFFPAAVMLNHWFQYSDFYGAYNSLVPQLEISGLNKDSVYTLKMTGSFTLYIPNVFNLNPMRYTVAGTIIYGFVDVNGNYNTSDGAIFNNIAPDANGKIRVYVNTYGGSNVASICGLQIIRGRTTAPVPSIAITRPTNNSILAEDGNFTFSATASETNGTIAKVEFYVNGTKIGEDSTAPYSITWVNPDEGHYLLTARAIDGLGNTNSASINVSVESLSSFWSVTGNIDANADSNFLGTVDTNRLAFRTNNLERMSILGDGTVGIGTKNTQGYKLAVNGNAIFTKVRIRNYASWPDYVFKKDYKLTGLDSLERYIEVNQHLPGIIPADKARKEGIDLADDQALLLKKIEELTLYLIQEHKRVEQLTKEVQLLKIQAQPKKGKISK
ncbi:MAG: hypothetical protein J0H74_14550 [Chitinophagaceae bacterium]|nr:hypothetical protein [Chitinophagaceae bacterium]